MPDVLWVHYVPLDGFLAWLIAGWSLPDVVEPIRGPHGAYSILMTRKDEPRAESA